MPFLRSQSTSPTRSVTQQHQDLASSSMMPFGQSFETQVNANMTEQDDVASTPQDFKGKASSSPMAAEACDIDYSEKSSKAKDDSPPRFSTIFQTPTPIAPVRNFESYPTPAKKSGVFIATPLFWALFAIVMFESAVLFGYTVVGLLNNMPAKLVHLRGPATAVGCDCGAQPVINISPNFGGVQSAQQETVTVTMTTPLSSSATSSSLTTSTTSTSSSTSTSTTSPSSTDASTEAAAIASNLAGLLKGMSASTSSSTTSSASLPAVTQTTVVTPPGSIVSSTTVLLVNASGHTITRPTVTATAVIDESQAAAASSSVAASTSTAKP